MDSELGVVRRLLEAQPSGKFQPPATAADPRAPVHTGSLLKSGLCTSSVRWFVLAWVSSSVRVLPALPVKQAQHCCCDHARGGPHIACVLLLGHHAMPKLTSLSDCAAI